MAPPAEGDYYFPPGRSIARRIHEERAVGILYGQRALLVGALEPLTYTGTMLSTRSGDRPFLRLARTAKIHEAVLLGTCEEADRALAEVRRVHRQVAGRLPHAVGRYRAGTGYSAFDPELMLWTLAVIADSARVTYETLVRPLSGEEHERLWADYRLFGELFGLSREAMPASYEEFAEWLAARLSSRQIYVTPHAFEVAPMIAFEHPVPLIMRPGLRLNNLVIRGTLPPHVREAFGLRWNGLDEITFKSFTAAHRCVHRLVPRRARKGRNDFFFDLVASGERRRGGTKTPALS